MDVHQAFIFDVAAWHDILLLGKLKKQAALLFLENSFELPISVLVVVRILAANPDRVRSQIVPVLPRLLIRIVRVLK